jgi:hypothetical protein
MDATWADGSGRWIIGGFATLIYGSFLSELIGAFRTFYGITSKRLIVLQPSLFSIEIESYYSMDIEFVRKKRWESGAGNIVFGVVKERGGKRTVTVLVGFFGIKDVDAVEGMILDLKNPIKPNHSPEPTPGAVN